jgi:hypothetical protein
MERGIGLACGQKISRGGRAGDRRLSELGMGPDFSTLRERVEE